MIRKIGVLTNYNAYGSKRHFASKFAEALNRHGIATKLIDANRAPIEFFFDEIRQAKPDLLCSFNSTIPYPDGKFFWDKLGIPFLSMVVDPIFYYQNLINSPLSLISCVDRSDCELLRVQGFEKVFFLPHGVERELQALPMQPRPYDVVFIGSSYDPNSLRSIWESKYDSKIGEAIDKAIEIGFSDSVTPFWEAVEKAFKLLNLDKNEVNMDEIGYFVDHYMRGKDRLELIKSIKGATIHVFGDPLEDPKGLKGWETYLKEMPNIVLHRGVSFEESLEIFKRSKICLNSVPSFKNGSHERIFISLATGCLPITTESRYIREQFVDGRELFFYQFTSRDKVNENIHYLLGHEAERQEMAVRGREKVMKSHTWDHRVEQLHPILNHYY